MESAKLFLALLPALATAQSVQKEQEIGRQLAAEVERHATVITDSAINGYVDRIAKKVAAPASLRWPLTIRVVTGLEGFATTLPGGFCFINSDLIQRATSESELAGVIAHQVGHLALWREGSPAANFMGSEGLCVRGIAHPLIPVSLLATQGERESQADLLGLEYLKNAGYDPRALADFYERALKLKAVRVKPPSLKTGN